MYSAQDLKSEISGEIGVYVAKGQPIAASWLVTGILAKHAEPEGTDREFYTHCAFSHVRVEVGRQVRRLKCATEEDAQLIMDGYNHVQQAYAIERGGEQMIVPVDQLSDEEIYIKMAELERMKQGLDEHVRELGDFILRRRKILPLEA